MLWSAETSERKTLAGSDKEYDSFCVPLIGSETRNLQVLRKRETANRIDLESSNLPTQPMCLRSWNVPNTSLQNVPKSPRACPAEGMNKFFSVLHGYDAGQQAHGEVDQQLAFGRRWVGEQFR